MAVEPLARDRLYPSLLDRLTDNDPTNDQEPRGAWAMSQSQLRESVLRDLNWLFNATRLHDGLDAWPQVRSSVLNFGLPGISGQPASSLDLQELARELRSMLLHFEPRLIAHTVRVHARPLREARHNVISFHIEAQLWSQPVPLEIFMRTDMDLESGQTRVVEARPEEQAKARAAATAAIR